MTNISVKIDGSDYIVGYLGNKLAVQKSGEPHAMFFKVKPDMEHTYKIQKTQIRAYGGAEGLYKHFEECLKSNFAVNAWVIAPLQQIIRTVKTVQ